MQHTKKLFALVLLFSIGSAQAFMPQVKRGAKFLEKHSNNLTKPAWDGAREGAMLSMTTHSLSNIVKQIVDFLNKKRTGFDIPSTCMNEAVQMAGFRACSRVVAGLFAGKEDADTYSRAATLIISVLRALKGDGWIS